MTNEMRITKDGLTVTLTQDAYLDSRELGHGQDYAAGRQPVYFAAAKDAAGNDYEVIWYPVAAAAEDKSERCDWDHPASITAAYANAEQAYDAGFAAGQVYVRTIDYENFITNVDVEELEYQAMAWAEPSWTLPKSIKAPDEDWKDGFKDAVIEDLQERIAEVDSPVPTSENQEETE